jgi:hypothetical protein
MKMNIKKSLKNITSNGRRGARTYLLLSGIGVAALASAPFAALFVLLKPEKSKKRQELFRDLNSSIELAGSELNKALCNAVEKLDLDSLDLFDPFGDPHMKEHKKYHGMTDEEWERRYGTS